MNQWAFHQSDKNSLKNLERDLKNFVFGQDKAIEELSSSIKLARAGLREDGKPIGSYLFSGPTGVFAYGVLFLPWSHFGTSTNTDAIFDA